MFKTQVASNVLVSVESFDRAHQVGLMATDKQGRTIFFPVDGDKLLALAGVIQRKFAEKPRDGSLEGKPECADDHQTVGFSW